MSPRTPSPPSGERAGVRGQFPVRMLRWVAVSPDGKRVAYQALGYVYVRDLPNGTPQAPDDADRPLRALPVLVARRRSPSSTRPGTTRRSARSASPPSPAGRLPRRHGQARPLPRARLLARRLEDRLHARGPAATCARPPGPPIPASTRSRRPAESPTLVVEDGFAPRFGKASDRVFFVKTEGGGDQIAPEKRILASIELDGSDVREHYLSELAQEFEISPDGKWLAFREGFNAYVTPFVETGTPRRHRTQEQGRSRHEGLEGRGREPPLLGRLRAPPLVASARSSSSAT